MIDEREIYCCGCGCDVVAVLVTGADVYPHRQDLHDLPFWQCQKCKNHVGCHHKTKNRTQPLGNIPTPELKKARSAIHKLIDPYWQSGRINRGLLYDKISKRLGYQYHTAEIKSIEDAREIYRIAKEVLRNAA